MAGLLVLSRKRNEKVFAITSTGERIEVLVVDIRGDKVRLGFRAAPGVVFLREEVEERMKLDASDVPLGDDL